MVIGIKQQGKSYFVFHRIVPIIQASGYNFVIIDTKNNPTENLSQYCQATTREVMGVWKGIQQRLNIHYAVPGTVKEKQAAIDQMYSKVMEDKNYIFIHDETQPVKQLLDNPASHLLTVYTASGARGINFIFCCQKLTGQLPTIVRENSLVFVYFTQPLYTVENYKHKFPSIEKARSLGKYECVISDVQGNGCIMDANGAIKETWSG